MRRIIKPKHPIYIISSAAVGGYEEGRGPLSSLFDFTCDDDLFSTKCPEDAEAEMCRLALNLALKKASVEPELVDVLLSGDLENQCVASSGGLFSFGIPYVGLYSACSTATEALLLSSLFLSMDEISYAAAVTSSHNSAAESQFRTPLEYGAQRQPTAQWTATAAGAFILSKNRHSSNVKIEDVMVGKIVDGGSTDGAKMGAAMARAAYDSIFTYLSLSGKSASSFDLIMTGDLGIVGSEILTELLERDTPGASERHLDAGTLLYDKTKKNLHSGASGCGCSASVLSSFVLPKIESGEYKNILFLSTGALMNPASVMRGNNILGIAPVICLRRLEDD